MKSLFARVTIDIGKVSINMDVLSKESIDEARVEFLNSMLAVFDKHTSEAINEGKERTKHGKKLDQQGNGKQRRSSSKPRRASRSEDTGEQAGP